MNNNEQNDLSYQRIQQLIKKQLDRIEHETDAKTEERPHKHNHTECSIIAIIKRFWRMRCLPLCNRKADPDKRAGWTQQVPQQMESIPCPIAEDDRQNRQELKPLTII